jgi:hypothetical protein
MSTAVLCCFYRITIEDHEHLFFQCGYSKRVWCTRYIDIIPVRWNAIMPWKVSINGVGRVLKLICAGLFLVLWFIIYGGIGIRSDMGFA